MPLDRAIFDWVIKEGLQGGEVLAEIRVISI